MSDTTIITYLNYSELFDSFERSGLLVPFTSLKRLSLEKGPQSHNASSGVCRYVESQRRGEARISNHAFANFFAPKQIFK